MVAVDNWWRYGVVMSIVESMANEVVLRSGGDADVLRRIIDRLDHQLNASPLQRTVRLWDLSATQLGTMFGISRQAASKWLADGAQRAVGIRSRCWVRRPTCSISG